MVALDPAPLATAPVLPEARPTASLTLPRALIERQIAMLTRLAEIGMEIAEAAGRQAAGSAAEAADGPPLGDPGLAYARAARAVRMTLFLQSRLAKDLADLDKAEVQARAERTSARRARLHRLVEQAIEAERRDEDEIEHLSSDAWERLRDADDEAELVGSAPFAEVVARICQDLQLSPASTARLLAAAGGAAGEAEAGRVPWPPEVGGAGGFWPRPAPPGPRTDLPLPPRPG